MNIIILIVLIAFLIVLGVFACKIISKKPIIGQIACLIISIVCFGFSIQQYSYGNSRNSSYESQLESLWENGTFNPGNDNLTISKCLMVAGIIFLVLFVVITIYKKKKEN